MRHLRSIVYAIVLAPTIWVLCGAGFARDPGFVPLLLAGAAYAILLLAPISPAGPLLAGVVFLGTGVWALASPSSYAGLWPPAGSRVDLGAPGHGLAALLAIPLMAIALDARRWIRYERPTAPVIGTVHGASGTARPAGLPAKVLETAIITRPVEQDTTVVVAGVGGGVEPPTETVPTVTIEAEPVDEATETFAAGWPGTPTFMVSSAGEITSTDVSAVPRQASVSVTEPAGHEQIDHEQVDTEPATDAAEAQLTAEAEPADAGAVAAASAAKTEQPDEAAEAEARTVAEPEPAGVDEPVAEGETVAEPEPVAEAEPEPTTAAEPAAETVPAAEAEPVAEESTDAERTETAVGGEAPAEVADEPAEEEQTAAMPVATTEREDERTQVIELLIAARPTEDLSGRLGNRSNGVVGEGGTTQVIRPRKPAAARDQGEETQVIKVPPADGEQTQVVRLPAARTAPSDGETTQVVRLPAAVGRSPFDNETTQVIRIGTQMVEPGERTQVLPIPAQPAATEDHITGERTVERRVLGELASTHDEPPTERHTPAPTSIVDAERPDPAEDPTTRLRVPKPDDDTEKTTVEVRASRRIMTVLNLERPQDEVAEDTRHLVTPPLPAKRHPDDGEPTS